VTVLAWSVALLALAIEPPAPSTITEPEPEPAPISEPSEVVEPSAQPAPAGGFGTIESTQITSDVNVPPPPTPEPSETGPQRELSGLIEAGYAQNDLRNTARLDHHGLSLRAHFVYYPWVSKRRHVAGGLGALYAYQGLNRWKLPSDAGIEASKAQQQQVMLSINLLLRPHAEMFSIHTAGMIGLGFYSNAKLFAADRAAVIRKDEYAFVAGGSLGLCSAWDIVCVTGGAKVLLGVLTVPSDAAVLGEQAIDPWGWHVGVGFDILRALERGNRLPM
jgi:hypothetical protein